MLEYGLFNLERQGKLSLSKAIRRVFVNPPEQNKSTKRFLSEKLVRSFKVYPIGVGLMSNNEWTTVFRFKNVKSKNFKNYHCQLVFGGKIKLDGLLRPTGNKSFLLDLYKNISEEHMKILVEKFNSEIYLNIF